MATYRLGCDRCDWSATTRGPGRAADGSPIALLYCPTCRAVRECAIGDAPPRGPLGVPLGPRHGQAARLARGIARRLRDDDGAFAAARCPVCRGGDLALAPREGQEPPCPRCRTGRLHARPLTD